MAQVNIRIDDQLKAQADLLFEELGLNMTTAITIFIRKVLRERGLPFEVNAKTDPFYDEYNQSIFKKSMEQRAKGEVVIKNLRELEKMSEDE